MILVLFLAGWIENYQPEILPPIDEVTVFGDIDLSVKKHHKNPASHKPRVDKVRPVAQRLTEEAPDYLLRPEYRKHGNWLDTLNKPFPWEQK